MNKREIIFSIFLMLIALICYYLDNVYFLDVSTTHSTITDWCYLAISVIGVYYVARTLKLQVKISNDQFKLLEIESRRSAREIKPDIMLLLVNSTNDPRPKYRGLPDPFQSPIAGASVVQLICINNPVLGVCFEYFKLASVAYYSENIQVGEFIGNMDVNQTFNFAIQPTACMGRITIIRIHYKDIDEREYYKDYKLDIGEPSLYYGLPYTAHPSVNVISSKIDINIANRLPELNEHTALAIRSKMKNRQNRMNDEFS